MTLSRAILNLFSLAGISVGVVLVFCCKLQAAPVSSLDDIELLDNYGSISSLAGVELQVSEEQEEQILTASSSSSERSVEQNNPEEEKGPKEENEQNEAQSDNEEVAKESTKEVTHKHHNYHHHKKSTSTTTLPPSTQAPSTINNHLFKHVKENGEVEWLDDRFTMSPELMARMRGPDIGAIIAAAIGKK